MRKFLKINFIISIVIGFVFGAAILFIGLDHNGQGEFYNLYTGEIDVIYIATLFFFLGYSSIYYLYVVWFCGVLCL
jgi:hypothetical protein